MAADKGTRLTYAANQVLLRDKVLQAEIYRFVGAGSLGGLEQMILRNSKALTTWAAVETVAQKMGVQPNTIIELITE